MPAKNMSFNYDSISYYPNESASEYMPAEKDCLFNSDGALSS